MPAGKADKKTTTCRTENGKAGLTLITAIIATRNRDRSSVPLGYWEVVK